MEEDGDRPVLSPPAAAVCVTGASGYIGSRLVCCLLDRGYVVHATARDTGKASRIFSSWGGGCDRLKLFRADLSEEGSFDEATEGCAGVFHVAAPMEFGTSAAEDIDYGACFLATMINPSSFKDHHVQSHVVKPAIRGTANLFRSCSRARTVKRVIFTSSISTITAEGCRGGWKSTVDESCTTSMDRVWKTKPNGWVYVVSKLVAEEKAFELAKEKGIELVSVIPPTVGGRFLTPSVPTSLQVLLSPVTGDPKLHPILVAVHSRLGSIPLVHIDDICNAHIFLMEKNAAKGRYMCVAGSCTLPQLTTLLSSERAGEGEEFNEADRPVISSKKLTDLGFKFRFNIEDIIKESVSCCSEVGFLDHPL